MNENYKVPEKPEEADVSPVQDMGEHAKEIFSGETNSTAVSELYAQTATLFSEIIKDKLPPREAPYSMLDVGSFKGDLVKNVLKDLGDGYNFSVTGIDINKEALDENEIANEKVVADICSIPLGDKLFDVSETRYVLVWNNPERQKRILKEITRVTKGFSIIQHAGADDTDTTLWQQKMHSLLSGTIPRLTRQECYFSSAEEIEEWMSQIGLKFERVQQRRVSRVSEVFFERFNLSDEEKAKALEILADKDYIYQTTWVISN